MADPLQEVAKDQSADAPVPRQHEQQNQARNGQRDTEEMNGEIAPILVAHRQLRQARFAKRRKNRARGKRFRSGVGEFMSSP